ncbi:MAG: hypothetical protein E7252_09440 [Lachnospira sp.]|nr:hypothetical protein [Lachnospira sp.]
MCKVKEKYLAKLTMVITIIFTMLFSTFMPIISYAEPVKDNDGYEIESDYVKFNLTWSNGSNDISMNYGTTYANFNIQFDTINQFTDFMIQVDYVDRATITMSNSGQYYGAFNQNTATQYLNKIPGGTRLTGSIKVDFAKDPGYSDYSRDIVVRLIGMYEDSEGEHFVKITKTLSATITTNPDITPHTASLGPWEQSSSSGSTIGRTIDYLKNDGVWMIVNKITLRYPILTSASRAEHTKVKLFIRRYKADGETIVYPTKVTMNSDLSRYFTLTEEVDEEDGNKYYYLEKGENHEEYDEKNIYSLSFGSYSSLGSLTVEYDIDDASETETTTTTRINASMVSDGWTQRIDTDGTSQTKTQITDSRAYAISHGLYRYTPGGHNWGNTYIDTEGYVEQSNLDDFVKNDKLSFAFKASFYHVTTGYIVNGNASITGNAPKISWYDPATNTYSNKVPSAESGEIKIKKITVKPISQDNEDANIKFYKTGSDEPFFTATKDNLVFEPEGGIAVSSYKAVASEMQTYLYDGWTVEYELSSSKLMENGLTKDQLQNLRELSQTMGSSGVYYEMGNRTIATHQISDYRKQEISHMRIGASNITVYWGSSPKAYQYATNLTTSEEDVGKELNGKIYLATAGLGVTNSNDLSNFTFKVTNPKFYVILPDQFDFKINSVTASNMPNMYVRDYRIELINGKRVLVVTAEGTFERRGTISYYDYFYGIEIDYDRILRQGVIDRSGYLTAYMETDEDRYYSGTADVYDYNENGDTEDMMAYDSIAFSITKTSRIQVSAGAYCASGDVKTDEAVIVPAGSSVKYRTVLDDNWSTIKNINIVSRLPFSGNQSIKESGRIELDSDATFTNLRNIKIYKTTGSLESKQEISSEYYTIGYSEDELASFDTEFDVDADKASTAKTLQIKFNSDYRIYSGEQIIIEYEMDVPVDTEEGSIGAEIVAVKYTNNNSNPTTYEQESAKFAVKVQELNAKVEVIKTFAGSRPNMDVSNIKIRLTNMYDDSDYYEKTTDEEGHALFDHVPCGYWKVTEETHFRDFSSVPQYVIITNSEELTEENQKAVNIVNNPNVGYLTIYKTWKNSRDIINKSITFDVVGTTVGGDEYTTTVTTSTYTDENDNVIQKAVALVPYGEYTIKERVATMSSSNNGAQWGWCADDVEVSVHSPDVEANVENKIAYGNLRIIKNVPNQDSTRGLKFHLCGVGDASYIDDNGQKVTFPVDETITINDQGVGELEHIPLGVYTLEEIEMPTITTNAGATERYIPIRKIVRITENGKWEEYTIDNKWKKGEIDVTVTATTGADLSLFKVQIEGTSYYGTEISEIYDVPATGKLSIIDVPLGKYKVTEYDTRTENGKIYTNNPDGFEVTYNPDSARTDGVEVEHNKVATVAIHNEYDGTGYLEIHKTLEGESDPSKAQGIQFRVKGKNLIGQDYNEVITIGSDGIGKSSAIPVGTYLVSEIEESVPDKYALVDDQEITIKRSHTQSKPLNLNLENPIATNNIVMETELKEGGYPSIPVTYKVTKVDDELNPIEEPIEQLGNKRSHAELLNMPAGRYLVEQVKVPSGYIKDDPQLVTISRKESGYALFIIERPVGDDFEKTRLTISKQVVNSNGEIATSEDYQNAKLDSPESYSFEFKIKNVGTQQIYYAFVGNNSSNTIDGLPYGTYEIEEVYKPKFAFIEITGEKVNYNEETGKYTFTFDPDAAVIQNRIHATVINKINTEQGFGGQDYKDNLNKIFAEVEDREFIKQAKIYIRDDENTRLSDATFRLLDSNGNVVKFSGANGVYVYDNYGEETLTPVNGAIVVKALPAGRYTLVNDTADEGHFKSEDREIVIYDSVVGVTRVELLRNIPRGTLRLSTVYTDENNQENYTPRSKYKIMNPQTYELLTFVKKADGSYHRSNLPNATDTIELKAGYVDVEDIEAGIPYQVGLVDVTEKYGMKTSSPETITLEEGVSQDVKVEVEDRRIKFVKVETPNSGNFTVALDENGKLWAYGTYGSPYSYGAGTYNFICINDFSGNEIIKDVQFVDFASTEDLISAIDTDGKLWMWTWRSWSGAISYGSEVPTCVSDVENSPFANLKVKKIAYQYYSGQAMYVLDENGKIWFRGSPQNCISGQEPWVHMNDESLFVNLSERCDLADVTISYIGRGCYNQMVAIDNNGKVWTWGTNYKAACGLPWDPDGTYTYNEYGEYYIKPTCISNLEGSNIKNVKMIKAASGDGINFLIDSDKKLWAFGSNDYNYFCIKDDNGVHWNPICLSDDSSGSLLRGLRFNDINIQYETVAAADTDGNLWIWGYESESGIFGLGKSYSNEYGTSTAVAPICVSELENNDLSRHKIVSVSAPYYNRSAAIDSEGNLWMWGDDGVPTGSSYDSSIKVPEIMHIAKFTHLDIPKFVKVAASYYASAGIDENGKVWTWGSNGYKQLGRGQNDAIVQIPERVGGSNDSISGETIVDISAGYDHILALDKEGKLWAWGQGYDGELGVYMSGSYAYTPICITKKDGPLRGVKIKKICAGYENSAVIDADGKLYTMGYNGNKQLGVEQTEYNKYVYCLNEEYPEFKNVKFVDARYPRAYSYNDCLIALDENGNVWTCGYNYNGQLGYEDGYGQSSTYQYKLKCLNTIEGNALYGKKIVSIENGGYDTAAAIDEDGNLYVWGHNSYGELGIGNTNTTYEPTCVTTDSTNRLYGKKIKTVQMGYGMTLVIDDEGKIYTSGENYSGQLGIGDSNTSITLTKFACINNFNDLVAEDISVGYYYVIAVDKNHNMWAWGDNNNYKTGTSGQFTKPVKWFGPTYKYDSAAGSLEEARMTEIIRYYDKQDTNNLSEDNVVVPDNLVDRRQVQTSSWNAGTSSWVYKYCNIALDSAGNLYTWGINNEYGILGDGTSRPRYEVMKLNDKMDNAVIEEIIYYNNNYVIVKDTQGRLWGWGYNNGGVLGNTEVKTYFSPICISEGNALEGKKITKTFRFRLDGMYAIDEDGKVYSWGNNYTNGILGNGQSSGISVPVCISEGSDMSNANIVKLQVIDNTLYATADDGTVFVWGSANWNSSLTGTNNSILSPIRFGKGTNYASLPIKEIYSLSSYSNSNLLLTTDGQLYVWGYNYNGTLGIGTTENLMNPVNLTDKYNFRVRDVIRADYYGVMIVDTKGKLWCWGSNSYGYLGTHGTSYAATCVSGPRFRVKEVVSTSDYTTVILDTQDRLWMLGKNSDGRCGNGTTDSVIDPYCPLGDTTISEVLSCGGTMRVIDSDGHLWAWGYNGYGACGVGSEETYVTTPTRVVGDFEIDTVYLSNNNGMIFTDTNGKIWASGLYGCYTTETPSKIPVCISEGTDLEGKTIQKILFASSRTFILDSEGKLYSWGANADGSAGQGSDESYVTAACINKGNLKDVRFKSVECTQLGKEWIMKAVDTNGKVWYWGTSNEGTILGQAIGKVTSPVCITDYYEELGFNPYEKRMYTLINGVYLCIDDEGKVWTWGRNGRYCGVGSDNPVINPTCITTEENGLNLKNGVIHYYSDMIYAINENHEAWVWGRAQGYPIKLNNTTAMKNLNIMELGFDTSNSNLGALADNGKIYEVSVNNASGIVVEEKEYTGNITEAIGNVTGRYFVRITDSEYNK